VAEQLRHPFRYGTAWGGMALYWAGEIVSLWAALRTFGLHASVAVVVLGYATGHVLTPRSLPLSGVGITELLLPLALNWVGLPLSGAVPAVFAYRIALLALSIPPAIVSRAEVRRLVDVARR
jgi:undecaprenyl-diphosphatase